jgi:hypothetical protein
MSAPDLASLARIDSLFHAGDTARRVTRGEVSHCA